MRNTRICLVLGALALGPVAAVNALVVDEPTSILDDDPETKKKKDEKAKTVTVWILEAKGSS